MVRQVFVVIIAVRSDVIRSFQRITGAPVVIVVAMTLAEMDSYPDESRARAEYLMAVQSTAMATQNLLLAAHAYGPGSYAAHLAAARARGLTIETFKDWRLAFDVDGPEQYATWRLWQEREHDGYRAEN